MKRLIPLFSLLICLEALGLNITNYPLTNDYSGNELFLLSSIPWKTNFNLPGNYVAKISELNSTSNAILAQVSVALNGTNVWTGTNTFDTNVILNSALTLTAVPRPGLSPSNTIYMWVENVGGLPALRVRDWNGLVLGVVRDNVFIAMCATPGGISKGDAVYNAGLAGTNMVWVDKARADSPLTMPALGIAAENITFLHAGRILNNGLLPDFNTTNWPGNPALYVSDTIAGALTNVVPIVPSVQQQIGFVQANDATAGSIQVEIGAILNDSTGTGQTNWYFGPYTTNVLSWQGSRINGLGVTNGVMTGTATSANTINGLQALTNGHSVAVTFSNSITGRGTNYWTTTNVFSDRVYLSGGDLAFSNPGYIGFGGLNAQKDSKYNIYGAGGNTLINAPDAFGTVALGINGANKLQVDYTGNVGIGVNSSSSKLQVYSTLDAPIFQLSSKHQTNVFTVYTNADVICSGTLTATNGVKLMVKPSFTTSFTCTTNLQAYCCDGTNQLITLPNAAYVPNVVYRFSSTNGWGSVIITNATGAQSIRDGTSLSYTNIGIGEFGVFSDGACWRLASKGRTILPSASWSSATTITPAQDTITNIPWTDLEFNNSQGITLRTNATFVRPTELWITNAGTYMITFSAVLKGSGGGSVISLWLRENGSDVVRSRTDQGFTGATAQQCMTVDYFVNVGTAPKFYELVAASHDASPPTIVGATANPTGYTAPAMPAVIVTINRVSDPWP